MSKQIDDGPRYKLLNCKLCNAPFEEHKKSFGGTYTRPLENISITLLDMKVVWNTQCVATAFVDFNKERIMDENNDSKSNINV